MVVRQKQKKIYAFIDGQNLNYGVSQNIVKKGKIIYKGWPLDVFKFRQYLKDKFRVNRAYYFIGYVKKNEWLYRILEKAKYKVVYKPTVYNSKGELKGNVDAELVLYAAAKEFPNYDEAVIVAGDGDYACLVKYLKEKNKLKRLLIPNMKSESSLLKKYQEYKTFIEKERAKLERIR